jgi:hypothetical protein
MLPLLLFLWLLCVAHSGQVLFISDVQVCDPEETPSCYDAAVVRILVPGTEDVYTVQDFGRNYTITTRKRSMVYGTLSRESLRTKLVRWR